MEMPIHSTASGRRGTVLVVDDEPAIRTLLRVQLQRAGFVVIEAGSAIEALSRLSEEVAALVTDISISPGTSGLDLARQARRSRPQLPILFMTGDAYQYAHHLRGFRWLQKPFDIHLLVCEVQRLVERVSGGGYMASAPRILVVDDEPLVLQLFQRVLSHDGYLVTPATNGREALLLLRDSMFELIVIDLSLPDVDGVELIRQVRGDSPHLKVLAVSGFMNETLRNTVSAAGAAAALRKPATPGELRLAVYTALDGSLSWRGVS